MDQNAFEIHPLFDLKVFELEPKQYQTDSTEPGYYFESLGSHFYT